MEFTVVLGQMIMLGAMMLMGCLIWKRKWIDETANKRLSWIVVNIFNPFLIISGVMGKDIGNSGNLLLQNIVVVIFFYLFLWLLGFLLVAVLHVKKGERGLYHMMTMFGNVGFMGIPVITSIFGMDTMIYIVFYMLGYNLLMYSYGMILAGKDAAIQNGTEESEAGGMDLKRIVNPGVISSILAVIIFLFGIELPAPVAGFCDYMGNPSIPLSMILVGVSLAQANLKEVFTSIRIYIFIVVRILILPVLAALIMKHIPVLDPVIKGVFILQMGMPVGSLATLVAKENGADATCCTNGIVLSTLASLLTIPIVCLFL